ncbi:MAG TPA: hypothetical protein VFG50_07780 [Rhodothermales bacterium]|nr:hypothetical protein [Rhodothermales bacterium]
MLQEQLDRVALMMDHTAPFTPQEAFVWRCLARHVDVTFFERTGKIVAPLLSSEALLASGADGQPSYSKADVEQALDALIAHGLLAVALQPKQGQSYRLYLPQSVLSGPDVATG